MRAQRREGQHEGSRLAHGKGHRPLPPRPRPFHRDDSSDAELGMDHRDPGTEGVKIHRPCGACRADSAFRRRSRQLGRRRQAKLARAGPRPRVRFWPARPSAGAVARDALRRFDARAIVMFHGLGGQFLQEPGRKGRLLLTPECPDPAAAEVQLALGPGDADEKQPPFLLQLLIVIVRTRVGQQSLLQRDRRRRPGIRDPWRRAASSMSRCRFAGPSGRWATPA